MVQGKKRKANPQEVIVTLAEFLACLSKSAVSVVKKSLRQDWRKHPEKVSVRKQSFSELEGSLPTGYKLIYESKDRKMCLFMDNEGHLVSADTTKFV